MSASVAEHFRSSNEVSCNRDGARVVVCFVDYIVQFVQVKMRPRMIEPFELIILLTPKTKSKHENPCDGRVSSAVS